VPGIKSRKRYRTHKGGEKRDRFMPCQWRGRVATSVNDVKNQPEEWFGEYRMWKRVINCHTQETYGTSKRKEVMKHGSR